MLVQSGIPAYLSIFPTKLNGCRNVLCEFCTLSLIMRKPYLSVVVLALMIEGIQYVRIQKIATPCSKLYHLLPSTRGNVHGRSLRNNNQLSLPKCRTERFKNSFIPAMCYSQVDVKSLSFSMR